jgi:hypothetical protein
MSVKNKILDNKSPVKLRVSYLYLCVITLLLSTFSYAQVTVKTDTTKIRIGEQIILKYAVDELEDVQFPKLELDSLKRLEVVKSFDVDTLKDRLIKKYAITSFDSGRFALPQQIIKIKNNSYKTDSIWIDVSTVAVDTIKQKLFPIKAIQKPSITFKDYAKAYWIWVLVAIFWIALVWYIFFRKRESEDEKIARLVAKIPPYELAVQQLHALDEKQLWQNNKIKAYYTELTDIIRDYLGKDIHIPTLELTTDEIIELINVQNESKNIGISSHIISEIEALLKNADLVKFAKSKPLANEIESDRHSAENIIKNIQPTINKYKEINEDVIEESIFEEVKLSTPNTSKKLSEKAKKNIIVISIVVLCLAGLGFGGKYIYDKAYTKIGHLLDTKSTEQLYNGQWQTQTFGNNDLSIDAPVVLKEETLIKLPERVKKLVVSMKTYEYVSLINQLQVMTMTSEYVEHVRLDINAAVKSGDAVLKVKPGVTDYNSTNEDITINGLTGKRTFGSYKDKGVLLDFQVFTFVKLNKVWMVSLAHKHNDNYGEKIIDRIITSIKINHENAE